MKTVPNHSDVNVFLNQEPNEARRADCFHLIDLMSELTGESPKMWGPSIVGFGKYHYRYESGREGDWFLVGFSPRKQALTLYIMAGFKGSDDLMERLGRYKTGKSCLYIKTLADIDEDVLRELINRSVEYVKKRSV